jgi:transposase-like protein
MEQKSRKRYSPEFKAQAVELLDTGKPVSQLAEELCISSNLLYRWRQDSQGTLSALRRQTAMLRQEDAILKRPQ